MLITEIFKRMNNKKINTGIIGLGYVGLPLALHFLLSDDLAI